MKIFVSKSFDPADRDVNSYFERIMKALGLQVLTAEDFTGESISVRVERLLAECDFLIGIYVIRYEDSKKSKVVTSQWMMRETFTAHGQGKQFIALVEYDRSLDATARLARGIAWLFNPVLYPDSGRHLEISQEEIGLLSGLSRPVTNKALQTLEAKGLLLVERNGLTVLNLKGLRDFGD